MFALLWLLTTLAQGPSTAPAAAAQPTVVYDRFLDLTNVETKVGELRISATFEGRDPPADVVFLVDAPAGSHISTVIFLLNDEKRITLNLVNSSCTVAPAALRAIADARSAEVAVFAHEDRRESVIAQTELTALGVFLDRTGQSAKAIDDRKRAATTARANAAEKAPSKQARREIFGIGDASSTSVIVLDATGSMMNQMHIARACVRQALIDAGETGSRVQVIVASANSPQVAYPSPTCPEGRALDAGLKFLEQETTASGSDEQLDAALTRARTEKSDTITFVTDGDPDEEIWAQIETHFSGKNSPRLNIVVVAAALPFDGKVLDRIKRLAGAHGGGVQLIVDDE